MIRLGAIVALATFLIDQGHKWWMLGPYDIASRGRVEITPFFDLVLAWNKGVSYGWFGDMGAAGPWILLGLSLAIAVALAIWLTRATDRISAIALGLLIGGALGNALDRLLHGAVADFFFFHIGSFKWYVFNLADVGIVAGVAGLLYSSWTAGGTSEAPDTGS